MGLDTNLFHNLRITIFIYYFLTTIVFLGILYYFLIVSPSQDFVFLLISLFFLLIFSGIIITKLSVNPLALHVENLQNLSKETLHELNLPITTIVTNIHLLKKTLQNEKNLKRLSRIESACAMLEERYNELDYMIKRQTKQDIKEDIDLAKLVQTRINFLNSVYPHIEFNLELKEMIIHSDKIGLSKVIDNIIDNGVKYSTNSNKIDIKLTNHILHIQDFGCGMDEVELLKIFDNYYQTNRSMHGFGIGLSMVKRFCDTNDIQLNFKSKPNFGTTVLLKFKGY